MSPLYDYNKKCFGKNRCWNNVRIKCNIAQECLRESLKYSSNYTAKEDTPSGLFSKEEEAG